LKKPERLVLEGKENPESEKEGTGNRRESKKKRQTEAGRESTSTLDSFDELWGKVVGTGIISKT